MTNRQAKTIWEDVLINGSANNTIAELGISKKEAKIFLAHTMPEMFVEDEINKINKKKIKELKVRYKRIEQLLKEKRIENVMVAIGIFFYFFSTVSILLLIAYLKYFI